MEIINIHFITGFSRGGTTWMCRCLNSHPDIFSFGETSFWGRNYLGDRKYTKQDIQELLLKLAESDLENGTLDNSNLTYDKISNILSNLNLPSDPSSIFSFICNSLSLEKNAKYVVEKTPHHINHIDRIRHYYPDSKIIIMDRDLLGFYLSYKNLFLIKKGEKRKQFRRNFHPLGVILVYKKYKRSISKYRKWKNTFYIHFDSIKADGNFVLSEVQDFLNVINYNINIGKTNSSYQNQNVSKDLSLEDKIWIRLFSKEKSVLLSVKDIFIAPLSILISIVKLPLWCIFIFMNITRVSAGNPFNYLLRLLR